MIANGISPLQKRTRPGMAILGTGKLSSLARFLSTPSASNPQGIFISPWRDGFVGLLTAELHIWLASVLSGQSPCSQAVTLRGTLLAMQYLRRAQLLTRRRGDVRE